MSLVVFSVGYALSFVSLKGFSIVFFLPIRGFSIVKLCLMSLLVFSVGYPLSLVSLNNVGAFVRLGQFVVV